MFVHDSVCISAQHTFSAIDLEKVTPANNLRLSIQEPRYEGIPLNLLRRMGKAVRLGTGAALALLKNNPSFDGIVIGTGNGGLEDCIKFLNQIIEFKEGTLTPTNFVQSTPNAIAAQIAITARNTGYNITHVHRGLSFENALMDSLMFLKENKTANLLTGGVDEISSYNYQIENLGGWFKQEPINNRELYQHRTTGTIPGEGTAMFRMNGIANNALAKIQDVHTYHTTDEKEVLEEVNLFLTRNELKWNDINLVMCGDNGDRNIFQYYSSLQSLANSKSDIARFKHYTGEFPSVSAVALWLAVQILKDQRIPSHMLQAPQQSSVIKRILLVNNYKGRQHGFVLVTTPD